MKELLEDEEHMDAVFLVHPADDSAIKKKITNRIKTEEEEDGMDVEHNHKSNDKNNMIEIRAHVSVLTARADYFKSFFRNIKSISNDKPKSKVSKSENNNNNPEDEEIISYIPVEPLFQERHIRYILEFIYTNRIAEIRSIATDDLLSILHLSDQWSLRDLKRLVEHALIRDHMRVATVARLYGATEDFNAKRLSKACIEFIMANLRQLAGNPAFEEEMKNYPNLCSTLVCLLLVCCLPFSLLQCLILFNDYSSFLIRSARTESCRRPYPGRTRVPEAAHQRLTQQRWGNSLVRSCCLSLVTRARFG